MDSSSTLDNGQEKEYRNLYRKGEILKLINADCIQAMKSMPDNSVDSIVTDPPYELGFMGKSWDATGIAFNIEVWQEALRVLKPGGHLIAFSGSRTYHRMAVAIEDAGFEIRDQIMWVYGSGFPKSHDVSKAIDKNNGETGRLLKFTNWMRTTGLKAKQLDEATGTNMGGHYLTVASQPAIPTVAMWQVIRPLIAEVPEWVDELVDRIEAEREVVGSKKSGIGTAFGDGEWASGEAQDVDITAPATAAAQQWNGWGTALKPAHEPIVLARKPIEGTVANNVLTWGVGGLNIDATRVGNDEMTKTTSNGVKISENRSMSGANFEREIIGTVTGRFPANFIHDGSDEVLALFPEKAGGGHWAKTKVTGFGEFGGGKSEYLGQGEKDGFGSAARFFYCAKASKRDRNEGLDDFEAIRVHDGRADGNKGGSNPRNRTNSPKVNHHPTVKPTSLMQYLVRLVTPPNGTVLDPFMGSGSTGKACAYEGFDFIGIDQSAEYVEIARARIFFAIAKDDGDE
jgi:DNA modification methylase